MRWCSQVTSRKLPRIWAAANIPWMPDTRITTCTSVISRICTSGYYGDVRCGAAVPRRQAPPTQWWPSRCQLPEEKHQEQEEEDRNDGYCGQKQISNTLVEVVNGLFDLRRGFPAALLRSERRDHRHELND